jgi:hypothetical protein
VEWPGSFESALTVKKKKITSLMCPVTVLDLMITAHDSFYLQHKLCLKEPKTNNGIIMRRKTCRVLWGVYPMCDSGMRDAPQIEGRTALTPF